VHHRHGRTGPNLGPDGDRRTRREHHLQVRTKSVVTPAWDATRMRATLHRRRRRTPPRRHGGKFAHATTCKQSGVCRLPTSDQAAETAARRRRASTNPRHAYIANVGDEPAQQVSRTAGDRVIATAQSVSPYRANLRYWSPACAAEVWH
jgi:hypothetical protein